MSARRNCPIIKAKRAQQERQAAKSKASTKRRPTSDRPDEDEGTAP